MGPGSLRPSRRSNDRYATGRTTSVAITGEVEPTGEFLSQADIGFKIVALPDN